MIGNTPVSEIMSKNIIALTRSDDLTRAEMLFKKHKIRHIPVVKGESIIGMLSYADLLKISYADTTNDEHDIEVVVYNSFTIEQVMTKDVLCIDSDTTIQEATEILAKREFHALPVVDESILVGIVTSTDLLNYFLKQL
ncbi:CBS domain-containing protein [Confluentibacter flavum]|uniref:CBS domain-containing protein n=1 Tax=Confluentibacter flavum TaxID=1909700 RepID=A0A2N3HGE2_9FLAO|nr:CBS domain-containing protein [Confluentibacter flavum]PKQ43983.1 CBS domain-containing protein [Confluentibacter flavum]